MSPTVQFASSSTADSLGSELRAQGLELRTLDGGVVFDRSRLLTALGEALSFPDYYGANWDAAEECLRDLPEQHPRGLALLFDRAHEAWQRLPREMGMLVSLWLAAAEAAGTQGVALKLVFLLDG
ncbi:MAG TPA: barstar family protein [Dongiaceae bacterium]|nr:barstar family protein [Dongiaceae bacterium]